MVPMLPGQLTPNAPVALPPALSNSLANQLRPQTTVLIRAANLNFQKFRLLKKFSMAVVGHHACLTQPSSLKALWSTEPFHRSRLILSPNHIPSGAATIAPLESANCTYSERIHIPMLAMRNKSVNKATSLGEGPLAGCKGPDECTNQMDGSILHQRHYLRGRLAQGHALARAFSLSKGLKLIYKFKRPSIKQSAYL